MRVRWGGRKGCVRVRVRVRVMACGSPNLAQRILANRLDIQRVVDISCSFEA